MDSESQLVQVAREYQADGYDVVIHPKGDAVPSFAAGYELDLIAKKGRESAIVAVAANRSAFAARPNLLRLAEIANAQPGWRFDLAVLGSESLVERIAHESGEPSTEQIEALLDRAERAATAGDLDAACVYAWAGLEAVMRRTASELKLHGRPLPNELLTTLYYNDLFSMDEFAQLRKAFAMRTRVVHGFLPTGVDPLTVQYTIAAAKKLMMGEEQKLPAAV